jgi:hypothetical protein
MYSVSGIPVGGPITLTEINVLLLLS